MGTSLPPLALIAGPTASGKSALALTLAERHDGVIINADASQVYAELHVLSARPSEEEAARAPHRLFGHVAGTGDYSAARWAEEAQREIEAAHKADKLPILVGGTGLYLRTLIDGIAPVPEIDPDIREAVRALPVAEAYDALTREDPNAARRLLASDTTRVARALEVVRSTGKPLATWQAECVGGIGEQVTLSPLIMLPDRAWLRARCDRRLEWMFGNGAVEEVRALNARRDIPENAPVRRAIGVTEISAWLNRDIDRATAISRAQAATRQYAKRQYTWFRNQPPGSWPRTDATELNDLISYFEIK